MKLKLSLALSIGMVAAAVAQVPVTVSRSVVTSGGTINLPGIVGNGTIYGGGLVTLAVFTSGSCGGSVGGPGDYFQTISGSASGSPSSISRGYSQSGWSIPITVVGSPMATIVSNAPSIFTNSISATVSYHFSDPSGMTGAAYDVSAGAGATYVLTIVDNGVSGGGGGVAAPSATLTGQSDPLENISRRDPSTAVRKLLGFQLTANTNAVLTGFAAAIYNTTTNGNPIAPIGFYRAAPGNQVFDASAMLVASTTNAGGYAIFTSLAESINGTNQTYFVAGSFLATYQTHNSFISATLNSQNITATLAGTNAAMIVNGGSILGKQYAFLDTTVAEDAAYALALTNGFVSASITNGTLNASATNGLASSSYLASALAGVSNTSTTTSVKSTSFTDSILPAAAAGAAAIGAAFSSDSLKSGELSKDYTPTR